MVVASSSSFPLDPSGLAFEVDSASRRRRPRWSSSRRSPSQAPAMNARVAGSRSRRDARAGRWRSSASPLFADVDGVLRLDRERTAGDQRAGAGDAARRGAVHDRTGDGGIEARRGLGRPRRPRSSRRSTVDSALIVASPVPVASMAESVTATVAVEFA